MFGLSHRISSKAVSHKKASLRREGCDLFLEYDNLILTDWLVPILAFKNELTRVATRKINLHSDI